MLGSSATTAPWTSPGRLRSPSYAAVWAAGSMVSSTLPPLEESLLSRSTSLVTNSSESSPESTSFWDCSIPVWL